MTNPDAPPVVQTVAHTPAHTLELPAALPDARLLSPRNAWAIGLCAAMLIFFSILSYSAVLTKTATFDEPLHAVSGYAIRQFGDYRIDPEDPALFTRLAALPHGSGALKFDTADPMLKDVTNQHDLQWFVAIKTLYRTAGNDADAYLNRSRFLFTLIGLATGALLCWWAWTLAGRLGAFAATAAYCLDPNFIGHASLVKNDVPLALVTVGLMCAIWRAGRKITWWNLAGIVLALAAAMNVKFSGPVFFIIAFLALLARALMAESWQVLRWELTSRVKRLMVPVGVCLISGIVAYLSIWACYGFRFAPTSDPNVHFDFNAIIDRTKANLWQIEHIGQLPDAKTQDEIKQIPTPRMALIIRWAMDHKLLPETWLHGFFYTWGTTLMRGSFLNGQYSLTGWWYFFPLSTLYKTPTSILITVTIALLTVIILWVRRGLTKWDILIGISLFMLFLRWVIWAMGGRFPYGWNVAWNTVMILPLIVRAVPALLKQKATSDGWAAVCLIVPVAIYGGMAMTSNFNLGIRHVLPLLPFVHIGVGIVAARMLWRWGKVGALVTGGLGMALAIESCSAWPDYIAFHNIPAGGWRGGVFKLSDSNLDWGQDLKLLAKWREDHKEKPLFLSYFGTADPEYYKIDCTHMPGGYLLAEKAAVPQTACIIAISATNLQGTYMGKEMREYYAPLKKVEPREILGGTIYLYDFPLRAPTTQK